MGTTALFSREPAPRGLLRGATPGLSLWDCLISLSAASPGSPRGRRQPSLPRSRWVTAPVWGDAWARGPADAGCPGCPTSRLPFHQVTQGAGRPGLGDSPHHAGLPAATGAPRSLSSVHSQGSCGSAGPRSVLPGTPSCVPIRTPALGPARRPVDRATFLSHGALAPQPAGAEPCTPPALWAVWPGAEAQGPPASAPRPGLLDWGAEWEPGGCGRGPAVPEGRHGFQSLPSRRAAPPGPGPATAVDRGPFSPSSPAGGPGCHLTPAGVEGGEGALQDPQPWPQVGQPGEPRPCPISAQRGLLWGAARGPATGRLALCALPREIGFIGAEDVVSGVAGRSQPHTAGSRPRPRAGWGALGRATPLPAGHGRGRGPGCLSRGTVEREGGPGLGGLGGGPWLAGKGGERWGSESRELGGWALGWASVCVGPLHTCPPARPQGPPVSSQGPESLSSAPAPTPAWRSLRPREACPLPASARASARAAPRRPVVPPRAVRPPPLDAVATGGAGGSPGRAACRPPSLRAQVCPCVWGAPRSRLSPGHRGRGQSGLQSGQSRPRAGPGHRAGAHGCQSRVWGRGQRRPPPPRAECRQRCPRSLHRPSSGTPAGRGLCQGPGAPPSVTAPHWPVPPPPPPAPGCLRRDPRSGWRPLTILVARVAQRPPHDTQLGRPAGTAVRPLPQVTRSPSAFQPPGSWSPAPVPGTRPTGPSRPRPGAHAPGGDPRRPRLPGAPARSILAARPPHPEAGVPEPPDGIPQGQVHPPATQVPARETVSAAGQGSRAASATARRETQRKRRVHGPASAEREGPAPRRCEAATAHALSDLGGRA